VNAAPFTVSIRPSAAVTPSMSAVPDREAAGSRDDDEPALVARALAGDRTALGVLVTRFAAPVRRLAYAILRDADEAEDAAQDGVLQALVKLDRYDPTRPFGPWLMRIVANAAIDRRRRRAVRDTSELDEALAGGGPLPDVEVDRLALRQRLAMALDKLPERYRVAVVLFDVEGYSQAEIAEILGVAPGTVRSAVFHARRRLRRWLEDWKEDGTGES
jgi:RNA polymerase sigma-70 factor, ECF subfamily